MVQRGEDELGRITASPFGSQAVVGVVRQQRLQFRFRLVLLVALLQGLVYLVLLPPWQHYDEPTHFEYAWLIANRDHWPLPGEYDPAMRREVAASMLANHFFWNLPKPDLFGNSLGPSIGLPELDHPPVYYLLVSLPLRLVRYLDVTSQLYVARSVSLLLFVLTVAIITGAMRDLVGSQHSLAWAIPAIAAGIPPVADVMTSVNSDVGAVFIISLFLWGVVRLLRRGYTWRRAGWVISTAVLAVFVKNTAAIALVLTPLVGMVALGQYYRWRLSWMAGSMLGLVVVALFAVFQGGDAADWYRWSEGPPQTLGTRANVAGRSAVMVEARPNDPSRYLLSPILHSDVTHLAGQPVTVGGWIWAKSPAVVDAPGLIVSNQGSTELNHLTHPLTVTTTPSFMAWTTTLAPTVEKVYYAFSSNLVGEPGPVQLFLSNPILVVGNFPTTDSPVFNDDTATQGVWAGRPFINVVRNAGLQKGWLRLRPLSERLLVKVLHRSPAQIVDALFDMQYTWPYLGGTVFPILHSEFFSTFAWGHVRLQNPLWNNLADILSVLALIGCVKWVSAQGKHRDLSLASALFVLASAGLAIWLVAIGWPLSYRWAKGLVPSARYTFPALFPTVLVVVGGWWALWPRRLRIPALFVLLGAVLMLDVAAVDTIWSFYHSLPTT